MATTDLYGIVGQVLDGQFRVDQAIGEGGFSVVYRGQHIGLDEPVAIKCLKLQTALGSAVVEGIVRRFRDESKIHYRLSRGSLHIARTIAAGTAMAPATGGLVPYMVLEWLDGYTLSEELRARKMRGERGRSLPEVIRLLDPVADAMAFAHAQGVVHRDLNPSNIFVVHAQGTTKLKVLDFGVAKVISDHALSMGPRVATIGQIRMFTPAYAAPEQFHDALGPIGPHTDVYSFAVMVVELLADRAPIEGEHIGEYADRALDPERRPTPKAMGVMVGEAVEAVIARAVTVDPSQRPRDIGEFWGMLKNAATRDAQQSRAGGEPGFPQSPVLAAPSARGVQLSQPTVVGMPAPTRELPAGVAGPPRERVVLEAARAGGAAGYPPRSSPPAPRWEGDTGLPGDIGAQRLKAPRVPFAITQAQAQPTGDPALGDTVGPSTHATHGASPTRKATLLQGSPSGSRPASQAVPTARAFGSPLPPGPGQGISSVTAFGATLPTLASAPTASSGQNLHLGDTSPSIVPGGSGSPHALPSSQRARWYTPLMGEDVPPFSPISHQDSQRIQPPTANRTRLWVVLSLVLTVALVVMAIAANQLSP